MNHYRFTVKPFEEIELNTAIEIPLYRHKMKKQQKKCLDSFLNSINNFH